MWTSGAVPRFDGLAVLRESLRHRSSRVARSSGVFESAVAVTISVTSVRLVLRRRDILYPSRSVMLRASYRRRGPGRLPETLRSSHAFAAARPQTEAASNQRAVGALTPEKRLGGPKLEQGGSSSNPRGRKPMLCRACVEVESGGGARRERHAQRRKAATVANRDRRRGGRIPDQLCSRCGRLLGPEDTVKRVRDKHSQLARFGLAGTRRSLLGRKRREDR
jgi:hypothetical protein